jgi:hypothetical protein
MRIRGYGWRLVALLIIPGLVQAATIGWQEAVARLAYERPVLVLAPEMHTSPSGAPMSRPRAATQSPGPRTRRCGSGRSQTVG